MKISLIVEGNTEKVFIPKLREYLQPFLPGHMPNLHSVPQGGRIPTRDKLDRLVNNLLRLGKDRADHVIALTDVYPDYINAADAKAKMRQWVGNEPRFHPHAAQFEFEAWLLPYWHRIQEISEGNQSSPGGDPEKVNHNNPPSHRIKQALRQGRGRYDYVKPRDAGRILRDMDLSLAVSHCAELKALVNSIMEICGGEIVP